MAKILWIRHGIPEPSRAGRGGAIYNVLSGLTVNTEVHLAALIDKEPALKTVNAITDAGVRIRTTGREDIGASAGALLRRAATTAASVFSLSPTDVWRYNPRDFREEVAYYVHEIKPDAVIFDQWFLYPTVQKLAAKAVYYAFEIEWLFNERFADETDNPLLSTARTVRGGRRKVYELKALARTDAVVCSSPAVAAELRRHHTRPLDVVPPPVDKPRTAGGGGFASREVLYATDNFGRHDATAVKWLAGFVMPKVLSRVPDAILAIYGKGAGVYLERLSNGTWLHINVGELNGVFTGAAVAAFPHWSGGGVNFAAVNAMAFGLPIVATPIGAEGTPGDESSGVAVRLNAEPFAEEIIKLLTDERLYVERSKAAGAYAGEKFYGKVQTAPFLRTDQNG
ncbi:MAG: glycosyltransferase family 4 protein [Candidatus Coatesbacteria bacterium]|nr:MAG: glycosyltransferase family 4 protein [Candidatus Coatesbacteria bacterium]